MLDNTDNALKDINWDNISLSDKLDVMATVLLTYKDEVDAVSEYMTEHERLLANMELSYLFGMLSTVEGDDGLNRAVLKLAEAEEMLQALCLDKLGQMARDQTDQIEKGLMVAVGIIPPEKIIEIRHMLDEVREMGQRHDRGHVEGVLTRLKTARTMLSGTQN